MSKKITIVRSEHFNAAHRLFNKNWSNEKNEAFYGKCNNPNYHGHNYDLEVMITGYINKESGFLIDMKLLSNVIKDEIIDYMDHKNLNLDVPEFSSLIPTAENIAQVIYNRLRSKIQDEFELKVKLYETSKNFVIYPS